MPLTETIVHEDGDRVYFVAPVSPIEPSDSEIEEYAFGKEVITDLRRQAPNPHIAWFGGHYVQADTPNDNGAMWTAKELAIKALTPMLMPVTVMHDPRTAVGLIADVALRTPEKDQVQRAKIETALALWQHRFPEAVQEARHNYEQGTLMQSMEAYVPAYECGTCGMGFIKLPHGGEQANWCAHLKGESGERPVRKLLATTFTGTGLIFGSRGATGADPLARLEDFKAEVAEFHQRSHRDNTPPRKPRSTRKMDEITIPKTEYDELRQRPSRDEYEVEKARADKAVRDSEEIEAESVKLKQRAEAAESESAQLKEQANRQTLSSERLDSLGDGFMAKLGEKTKSRLREQAATLKDEEWASRLEELEEMAGVKSDAAAEGNPAPPAGGSPPPAGPTPQTFSQEELARLQVGGQPDGSVADQPSVSSVMRGLVRRTPAGKK